MEDKEIRKRHTGSADGSRYDVVVESPQHHEALSSSTSERRLFESDEDVTTHSKIELSLSEPIPTEKPFKQYMLALLTLAIGNVRCPPSPYRLHITAAIISHSDSPFSPCNLQIL